MQIISQIVLDRKNAEHILYLQRVKVVIVLLRYSLLILILQRFSLVSDFRCNKIIKSDD